MVPGKIKDILDLSYRINKQGRTFNVLLSGAAGLGKSEIVQQWCTENSLPFIDLRAAYLEAPDVIGFPSVEVIDGRQVTKHNIPEFWPHEGEGVLFIDEINRGTTAVMNTFMQLLTDRKVHNYTFPQGWLVVAAVNPESDDMDVNTMDTALKNRFETFEVQYDRKTFVDYMRDSNWDSRLIAFVESGIWEYKLPEELKNPGAKYVSPRSLSKLNNVLAVGCKKEDELLIFESILGKNYGKTFWAFLNDESPVLMHDLITNRKASLKKIKAFSDPKNYKNGLLSITLKDIVDQAVIDDQLLAEVVLALPADQGPALIRDLEFKRKDDRILSRLTSNYPEIKDYFKAILKGKQ